MSLDNKIVSIMNSQPSGTYLIEVDNSIIPNVQTQNGLRLLIGQSKHGPVNKPMYIDSWSTFKRYFGDIDRTQERNGNYFGRFAKYMLTAGPILAMSIRSFDDELDTINRTELSTKSSTANAAIDTIPYVNAYNTQQFWYLEPQSIIDQTNTQQPLNIVNVSSSTKSVFVRKSTVTGYDTTVEDWYAMTGLQKPAYLPDSAPMSDFMVDVYVFDNAFTNAKSNKNYGHLFNNNGVMNTVVDSLGETRDGLDQLAAVESANFVQKFTGSLIPSFTDIGGNSMAIDVVINSEVDDLGLLAAFNMNIFDTASLWTADADGDASSDGMKKNIPIDIIGQASFNFDASADLDVASYPKSVDMLSYKFDATIDTVDEAVKDDAPIAGASMLKFDNVLFDLNYVLEGADHTFSIASDTECYKISEQPVKVGAQFVDANGNIARVVSNEYVDDIYTLVNGIHTRDLPLQADGEPFPQDENDVFIYPVGHEQAGSPVEYVDGSATAAPLDAPAANTGVEIPMPTLTDVEYVALLKQYGDKRILSKLKFDASIYIDGAQSYANQTSETPVNVPYVKESDDSVWNDYYVNDVAIYQVVDFDDVVTEYSPITLNGYVARDTQFCNNTITRQNDVLSVVTGELRAALKNKELLSFSYVVDAFKTYIGSGVKEQLSAVVAERQMCTYLGSGPSITEMIASTDPYFKATATSKFSFEYLRTGGNTSLPYRKLFSLPTLGASYAGFFVNNFIIDDNGLEVSLPPSGIVSNAFVNKRNIGQVYEIASGPARGAISAAGVKRLEYVFTDADRKVCEDIGLNPIIIKRSTGMQIKGNSTAYVKVKSALSLLHVREMLNELEMMIRSVLERYEDNFNTVQNRLLIKTQADTICRNYAAGGALKSFENIMNEQNNDEEILDNELGLLDTVIIPSKGMKQLIHRVTINSNSGALMTSTLEG